MPCFRDCARLLAAAAPFLLPVPQALAQATTSPTAAELAEEIGALKSEYESRIRALEEQLEALEAKSRVADTGAAAPAPPPRMTQDNVFNPAIGVIFDGRFARFTNDHSEIPGFQTGHEGERGADGFSLGHTEVTMSGNVDDKFSGNLTLALDVHPGEPVALELEEVYIQTLPGAGLPDGARIKAGRALWTFGYLNELHVHADDFSDRPLPYRVYLDNHFNDDGVEAAFVLPTDLYAEIGGGGFRGDDRPFAGSTSSRGALSAYARVGGDFGRNGAWRIGGYVLDGAARDRPGGHAHGHGHGGNDDHDDHDAHDDHDDHAMHDDHRDHDDDMHDDHDDHDHDMHDDHDDHDDHDMHDDHGHGHAGYTGFFTDGMFTGDTRLFGADVRVTWAPTGNPRQSELILQGEYFRSVEEGTYVLNGEALSLDGSSSGWYAQAVYKFLPSWRVGARYSRMVPPSAAEIDEDIYAVGLMTDWTNSEFGRIRLQYNRESLAGDEPDDQILLQYIMSLGAHAAHTF